MARFEFKLNPLKKFRERRLLIAKKDMIEVESRRQKLLNEKSEAETERVQSLGWNGEDLNIFLGTAAFIESTGQKIDLIKSQIQNVDVELERHRSWVAHLSKELKAVERLEEKQRQNFDDEKRLGERRFQDAWVVERWGYNLHPEDREEDQG